MCILSRFWQGLKGNERGQIAVLMGFLIVGMIGFSALAIDVGSLVSDKRDLQNAADAMALAGAQDLPSAAQAATTARTWAPKNGVIADEIVEPIEVKPQNLSKDAQGKIVQPNPEITVTLHRDHRTTLARVIGIDSIDLEATASAIKTSPGATGNLAPWSVPESALIDIIPGETTTLKWDSTHVEQGNFQPIAIDGTGGSVYEETIANGSKGTICSVKAVADGCTPTANMCNGATCRTETGNMIGPTKQGLNDIYNSTDPSCHDFDQVFPPPPNDDGTYRINTECNPFVEGVTGSPRVLIVPVIQSLCNGACDVTIVKFAIFFLEGEKSKCTGNDCLIEGRFIRADFTMGAVKGTYDPSGLLHFVVLVE